MKVFRSVIVFIVLVPASTGTILCQTGRPSADEKEKNVELERSIMSMSSRHMDMGSHMRMSAMRQAAPGDEQRAKEIVRQARQAIDKYTDYKIAVQDGYRIFLPGVPQSMYHFNNEWYAMESRLRFDASHPTSLLYEKVGDGYKLIGLMYTAPADFSEEELDKRVPLSIAQWHQHVNLCMPPKGEFQGLFDTSSKFGLNGSITTREGCDKAGGRFFPRIFGWMVHMYPFEKNPSDVWSVERQLTASPHHMH